MYILPEKIELWTIENREVVLRQLKGFYRKYDVAGFYVVGSRCNGILDPNDIDISLDVRDDIISWRNLDMRNNFAELTKRAIIERRLKESFGEQFNVIIEKECSQIYYKTIEKFSMPYYDLSNGNLYNKKWDAKFPYKIVTYDYDNHIFYMKLRKNGLTEEEIVYYNNKIYENLNIQIQQTITLTDKMKKWIEKKPWKIISFLSILSKYKCDLDTESKNYIKKQSIVLKTAPYNKIRSYIKEAIGRSDSDIFIKLFHDCEIYENLSVF